MSQVTRDELMKMSGAEIVAAHDDGRLNDLLGTDAPDMADLIRHAGRATEPPAPIDRAVAE